MRPHNEVHILGRVSVLIQQRPEASGLVLQFHVLRSGTLSEIQSDNLYQPLNCHLSQKLISTISIFKPVCGIHYKKFLSKNSWNLSLYWSLTWM